MNDVERRIATLISEKLGTGLTHPGDPTTNKSPRSVPIPAFRTTGMPQHLAKMIGETAELIGEAIVHTIQAEGNTTIIDNNELDQLRQQADQADTQPAARVTMICKSCSQPMAVLKVKGDIARVDGRLMLATLSAFCPHKATA